MMGRTECAFDWNPVELCNGIPLIPPVGRSDETNHHPGEQARASVGRDDAAAAGMFEEQRLASRGPEGVYLQPSEKPGFGLALPR